MKHTLGTLTLEAGDIQAIKDVMQTNWLSPGPQVQAFENAFAKAHHNRWGVMVNSGTDALRIALAALKEREGWKDGTAVLVPSVTFVATVNVLLQLNLKPEIVDVSRHDGNINLSDLEHRLRCGTGQYPKAVIAVHLGGRPCAMTALLKLAQTYGLKVIEDSCEAMGVSGIGRGDVTCFSFYAAHLLVTGVGGMAITRDRALKELMWSYLNHGRREPKRFTFDRIGYSCRPTEFEAVLGLRQLPHLPETIQKRRAAYSHLQQGLLALKAHLYVPEIGPDNACMFLPVILNADSRFGKWDVMRHLTQSGIETRELMPLINQPCYAKEPWYNGPYATAQHFNAKAFYVGCHQKMTPHDLDEMLEAFIAFPWGKIHGKKVSKTLHRTPQSPKQVTRRQSHPPASEGHSGPFRPILSPVP